MPDVFVSYSHKDSEYAHRLADVLRGHGIDVWIDERIDYGDQWPRVIQDNLNACRAFLLLMSTNAFNSVWVQNEVSYAQANRKPIYPLLLEGSVWLSMAAMQYVDVRGGKMPPARFYEKLRVGLNQDGPPIHEQRKTTTREAARPKKNRSAFFIAGAMLLCLAAGFAVAPPAWRWLSLQLSQEPPAQVKATAIPAKPSATSRPASPAREPSPTPEPALPVGTYSVAEKYGLPYSGMEVSGLWFEAGVCYDLDFLIPGEDPGCDAFLDIDDALFPVNGARVAGYLTDRSLDLEVCRAIIDEKQNIYDPVYVPGEPVVCFVTNEGGFGFLIAIDFDREGGITFDAYVIH